MMTRNCQNLKDLIELNKPYKIRNLKNVIFESEKKIRSIEFSKCRTKYGGFKIPELDIDNFSPAKVTEEISVRISMIDLDQQCN